MQCTNCSSTHFPTGFLNQKNIQRHSLWVLTGLSTPYPYLEMDLRSMSFITLAARHSQGQYLLCAQIIFEFNLPKYIKGSWVCKIVCVWHKERQSSRADRKLKKADKVCILFYSLMMQYLFHIPKYILND